MSRERKAARRGGARPAAPPALLLPTSLDFLALQAARCRADHGGLIHDGRRLGYPELAEQVTTMAGWLAQRGVGAGHRVAIMAANSPAMVVASYAVWQLGAVSVPVAVRSTSAEASHLLTQARAAALLCDEPRADVGREAGQAANRPVFALASPRPRILRRGEIARGTSPRRGPRPLDLAVLAYTSGTTGKPKGAMISHANLLWSSLACAAARGDTPASVGASISPLTHTPVFVSHLLCRILSGATTVLLEKFDLPILLEAVERFGVTDLPLIGGMVFDVVAMRAVPDTVRRVVRKVSVGGAPTPMTAKRELARIFDGAEIIEAYGQTESTDGVTMARGTSVFDRPGTIGAANPHVIVAVRRADGSLADADEDGEIVVGGPTVMGGYDRDRAATAQTIRDGWLHTGDRGRRDPAGFFYITGRMKDLIITGGENVSPVEVEDVIRTHPDIDDVAVIGTPHPRWGEQVTAVVVRRAGSTLDGTALAEFAALHLAGFKKPRRVEFVERLPRNAANKVMTGELRATFAGADLAQPGGRTVR